MMPRHSQTERRPVGLRIVMQYREKGGMAYEFDCDGSQLSVRVSPRADHADPAEWCVEARVGRTADTACISGWALTRSEALREVGRRWRSEATSGALPPFDWAEVERALSAVRAI